MSAYRRNLAVGVTVLTSLLILGWMLLKFGSTPAKLFADKSQLDVHFVTDRADGLSEGSPISYLGITVGRITKLRQDENQQDVLIDALVDDKPSLPGNLSAIVRTQSLLGGTSTISLVVNGPLHQPEGKLEKGQTITAHFVGLDLIPPQFGDLAVELQQTSKDLRDAKLIPHLDETVRSASEVMKSLRDYVNDPKLRNDLTTSLANFREVTEKADRAASNVEKFSDNLQKVSEQATATLSKTETDVDQLNRQLNDRMAQASKLLDSVQSIVTKVDQGKGTAGMLVNDPKLYQSLVDSSRDLNLTITDLRRLLEQWEQEGVSFKLK